MPLLEIHEIAEGVSYLHKPDHRDGTRGKSQWVISKSSERDCFSTTRPPDWTVGQPVWGLHAVNGRAALLGVGKDGEEDLFVAKFVDPSSNHQWHGYPVSHKDRNDKPPAATVLRWQGDDLIRIQTASKI